MHACMANFMITHTVIDSWMSPTHSNSHSLCAHLQALRLVRSNSTPPSPQCCPHPLHAGPGSDTDASLCTHAAGIAHTSGCPSWTTIRMPSAMQLWACFGAPLPSTQIWLQRLYLQIHQPGQRDSALLLLPLTGTTPDCKSMRSILLHAMVDGPRLMQRQCGHDAFCQPPA